VVTKIVVQEDDTRLVEERARQGNPLAQPPRERTGELARERVQREIVHDRVAPRAEGFSEELVRTAEELEVLPHGQV
jgi:hypothetical protein